MNMKRLIPCFLIAGITFFSACEKGQMADMEKQGTELPEGKYPLTFTAVQAAPEGTPQTRVSENTNGMSSHWDGGEVINVQIADGKAGTYTLDENGKTTAQTPCYWQNTDKATINAWYSNISEQNTETNTDKIVSLSNQSKGLAYVLKATANDVNYNSQDIELQFRHQLAKVRVMLTGEKADGVESVQVNNYTSCTVTNGDVLGKDPGYIQMRKNDDGDYYEANLVPMKSITSNDFIKLNGKTQANVSNISQLDAETVYTIKITVNKKAPVEKNISDVINESNNGKYTVEEGEHLILQGNGQDNNRLALTLKKGSTLELKDVIFSQEGITVNAAITVEKSATIIVSGTNTITGRKGDKGTIEVNDGTLTIKAGSNADKLELITPDNNIPGLRGNGALALNGENAHLVIESGHIIANASQKVGAAGIGSGHWQKGGNITIKGGIVEATGGSSGAGIGSSGANYPCGNIEILGGTVTATGGSGAYDIGPGKEGACGTVFIGSNATVIATNNKIWGQN